MSHTVTIRTKLTDLAIIRKAAELLGLPTPVEGRGSLYDGSTRFGTIVQLEGWSYPVIVENNGQLAYDNFEGHWGDKAKLDKFIQTYAVEKTKAEAKLKGHRLTQTTLPDGSIKLTITTK